MSKRYQVKGSDFHPQKIEIYDTHHNEVVISLPKKLYKSFHDVIEYMEDECVRLNNEHDDDLLYLDIVENYGLTFRQKIIKTSKKMFTTSVKYCQTLCSEVNHIIILIVTGILAIFLIMVERTDKRKNTL